MPPPSPIPLSPPLPPSPPRVLTAIAAGEAVAAVAALGIPATAAGAAEAAADLVLGEVHGHSGEAGDSGVVQAAAGTFISRTAGRPRASITQPAVAAFGDLPTATAVAAEAAAAVPPPPPPPPLA